MEKGTIFNFIKKFRIDLIGCSIILLTAIIITIILIPISNNLSDHFVDLTKKSVSNLESDNYVVSLYQKDNSLCLDFVQELEKLEKKYKINFYLVNVDVFPSVLEKWKIEKYPFYFVFERKGESESASLIYQSYGHKDADILYKEIYNVKTYGIPKNTLSTIYDTELEDGTSYLKVSVSKIYPIADNNYEFTITYSLTNNSEEKIEVNSSFFKVISDRWDNEAETLEIISNDTLEIDVNESKEFDVTYKSTIGGTLKTPTPYYQIMISFYPNGCENSTYIWRYKQWDK